MKTRMIRTALALTASAGMLGACGTTPGPECIIARLNWIARYVPKPGNPASGACISDWQSPPHAGDAITVNAQRHGEVLGIQKYGPPSSPTPWTVGIFPDQFSVNNLGSSFTPPPSAVAVGTFASNSPDANNFCSAGNFNSITLPGTGITYKFDNAKFYVTAAHLGLQMTADLAYTSGGCTANYTVVAMSPEVACDSIDDCNPFQIPGQGFGSGISPEFPIICDSNIPDPDWNYCNCASADFPTACRDGNATTGACHCGTVSATNPACKGVPPANPVVNPGNAGVCMLTGNTVPQPSNLN